MTGTHHLTDRPALLRQRQRATKAPVLFLHEEAAADIEQRLAEVNKPFNAPGIVGHVTKPLTQLFPKATVIDDTAILQVTAETYDLIIHSFGLHWADDPIGQMVQSRLALMPDGLFLAVLFGGSTLQELRASLAEAETRLTCGLSPRVLPMGDLRELGGLIQRAGLALPVADSRRITIRYRKFAGLVRDLRGMGETNALLTREKKTPPRELFTLAEDIYFQNFSDGDGYLLATVELVYLTGWAPSKTQQEPLAPGSARRRLADALGVVEAKVNKR